MLTATTASEINDLLDNHERVVVVFSSPSWCAPCRRLAGPLEEADEKLKNVTFVKVDPDEADPELVSAYNVSSVPTLIEFEGTSIVGNVIPGPAKRLIDQLA